MLNQMIRAEDLRLGDVVEFDRVGLYSRVVSEPQTLGALTRFEYQDFRDETWDAAFGRASAFRLVHRPSCDDHKFQSKVEDPFDSRTSWVCQDCGIDCGEAPAFGS